MNCSDTQARGKKWPKNGPKHHRRNSAELMQPDCIKYPAYSWPVVITSANTCIWLQVFILPAVHFKQFIQLYRTPTDMHWLACSCNTQHTFMAAHIMGWKLKELLGTCSEVQYIPPTPHSPLIFTKVQRQVTYLLDTAAGDFAFDTGLDVILGLLFLVPVSDDTFSSSPTTWNKTQVTLLINIGCAFYTSSYPEVTWLQTHIQSSLKIYTHSHI
jgi:hypothetical protein